MHVASRLAVVPDSCCGGISTFLALRLTQNRLSLRHASLRPSRSLMGFGVSVLVEPAIPEFNYYSQYSFSNAHIPIFDNVLYE